MNLSDCPQHLGNESLTAIRTTPSSFLERFFNLKAHGTTVRRELIAGLTTFSTMAYIVFVNPAILQAAGMDPGAVMVATILSAVVATLIMALYANYPFALALGWV